MIVVFFFVFLFINLASNLLCVQSMAEVSVAHGSMSILRTRIRLSCIMPDFGAVSTWPCGDWAEKITQQPCIVWKISCHRRWRIFVVVSAEFQYASTVDGIWCDGPHRNKTDILNVIQPVDVGILSIRLRLQPRKFLFVFIVTFKQMISGGEFRPPLKPFRHRETCAKGQNNLNKSITCLLCRPYCRRSKWSHPKCTSNFRLRSNSRHHLS